MAALYAEERISLRAGVLSQNGEDLTGNLGTNHHAERDGYTLLAFAFFPTTFYFRMAYTESPFGAWRVLCSICI